MSGALHFTVSESQPEPTPLPQAQAGDESLAEFETMS
jgi:hypothetical protein